jgi:putative ABC transport system permease protein
MTMTLTAPWRKVVRDVWRERTRAVLVVLAIAIGLAGFLAVLSTYAILRRELDRGYLVTNPASAVLVTDGIDDALLADVIARDDVSDADARRVLRGRFRNAMGEWRRLTLFVIRDFRQLRISTVTPEAGAWPPAAGELLIERDAFQVARAQIGETVTIETAPGRTHTLRVAGRVHDAGQAQARMEHAVYAYITPETLAMLGETARLDRLYLLASGDRFDAARVRRMADDVKGWLEGRGHRVRRVDVPTPGEHPHALIMGALLLAMAAFGLLVLALSGIIVVNLLLAMMAAQRRQIGVMKAVGGTRGQIARIYLAEAALFGVAAILVAAPAGVAGGRVLSREFAVLLNFDLATLAVPAWVYLLVILVGLLVPLAAAAYPVAADTRITVQAAVASAGAGAGAGAGVGATAIGTARLDRVICALGGARTPWLLGVRNSVRHRARTMLTLATLTAAGAFFMSALNVRMSMMATLDRMFGDGTYGADRRYSFDQHMLMIYVFLIVVSGVLAVVGGLGLMTATSLNMLDRRREFGVLRAIGATPSTIAGIVIIEALFIALLAWGLALLVAWPMSAGIGRLLMAALFPRGLEIAFSPAGMAGWLGISTALSVVSSLGPAMSALRRPIREALSHE